jgi:DNA-binding MarR family transcriptional regulator/GNAT superfamily N-acetyltransferase
MNTEQSEAAVEAFRRFNRFYTRHVGALDEGLLQTRFTLTEARVLYELGTRDQVTATAIGETLALDPGYLSRILSGFAAAKLVSRKRAPRDRRQVTLTLTAKGRRAFQDLNSRSQQRATEVLEGLGKSGQQRLISAMSGVEELLSNTKPAATLAVIIREPRPGDIGWAIAAHGELYAREFGLNEEFEALVATLFARFAAQHDPARERLWIAELNGERVGCVFVVRNAEDPDVAQLRCLLVDPKGRGLGIGRRLVDECLAFAKRAGYRAIMLWTNDVLVSARRIYEAAGFTLEKEERHHSFGRDLVGQFWRRDL